MTGTPLRVALVSPRYPPHVGGLEHHVARLATGLLSAGVDVEVLTQEDDRNLAHPDVIDGVAVRRFAMPVRSHVYPVSPALWSFLRRNPDRYDVVHGHGYHTLAALGAALCTPAPFVYTPHYHGTGHSPLRAALHTVYRPVGGIGVRRAAAVVCVSEAEARLVADHFPSVARRITVIPNGIDRPPVPAAPRHAVAPVILSLGRLEAYKRVDRLIASLAALPPTARLVVVGDGPDRERLTTLAADLGVADRVTFTGRVPADEVHQWLAQAGVVATLSEHEAFGMVVLEARVAGARVVASDIPAHREVMGYDDGDGISLVPVTDDAAALQQALHAALAAPPAPPCTTAPTWQDVVRRTIEVYDRVRAAAVGVR